MKHTHKNQWAIILVFFTMLIAVSCRQEKDTSITLDMLLDEMVSFDEAARYPAVPYTCRQESSYDRRSVSPDADGWFANNDGFGIIRIDTINGRIENVLFDQTGPGVITRIWLTTLNKQGKMRFYFDHATEAQWVIPAYDLMQTGLPLGKGLLQAHTSYTPDGKGGNTLFLPIPYAKGCKITFELPASVEPTPKYYQINYRQYPTDTKIETFTLQQASTLHAKLDQVSNTLLNPPTYSTGETKTVASEIQPQQSLEATLPTGSNAIYTLTLNVQTDSTSYEQLMRELILQISFDSKQTVFVPLGDFSAGGMGAYATQSWFLSSDGKGNITSRWVMPYQQEGKIQLFNASNQTANVSITVTTDKWQWDDRSLYFHTSWKQENGLHVCNTPDRNEGCKDWTFADITNGRGVYKGDVLSLFNHTPAWYGEGDEKIWVDDDTFPSHFGTGTEDYYNSSWAPVIIFQTPFGGAPRADLESSHGYNTFFRTRNLDGIPFNNKMLYELELLSWIPGQVDYSTTTYWYGDSKTISNGTSGIEEALRPLLPKPQEPEKFKIKDAIEFELIKPIEKSANITADEQNMAGFISDKWSNEKQVLLTGGQPGEYVTYEFDAPEAAKYKLVLHATKAADYGIISFYVNGEKLPVTFDGYGNDVKNHPFDLGKFTAENGKIKLKIEITGTNQQSVGNGYFVGLDCIEVTAVK